ncbi:MAG TPA: hypothetical protein VF581_07280 [Flavobacterium sp.]|jgi:hypothetical protein
MRIFLFIAALFLQYTVQAQKPCEFAVNVTDSLGTYKETKESLVFERNFAGTSSYAYFSLAEQDGTPLLNIQFITSSKEFVPSKCLDKNSRVYLQLANGKIVTLLHLDQLTCGTSVRNDKGFNNMIMTGNFMFMKNSFEELRKSPLSVMRIKFTTETADFIFQSEFKSELDSKTYTPQEYFITELDCILG